MESIKPAGIGYKVWPLRLVDFPDGPIAELRMTMRLGVSHTLVEQPSVQLIVALEPQPWRKEALADKPNLVLDLPLLPARPRRACNRLDQVMAAHLEETAI